MGERAAGSLSPCHYSTALFSTKVLWTIMMKQQMVNQLYSASSCIRVWLPAFIDTQVSGSLSRKKIRQWMCSEATHPPIHLVPPQRNQQQIHEHCQNGCYSLKKGTKLPNSWQDLDLNKEFAPWTGNPAGNLRSMGGALLQHCSVQALLLSLKWGRRDKCKWHLCAFLSILIWLETCQSH